MKTETPRDPGELVTLASAQLRSAYAAFVNGQTSAALALFEEAGRITAEACRYVHRELHREQR